ncbi:MAG: hypothetical protein KBD76_14210 [Bacteriovorax sp.]|nr:hypothetical protein [Bacteriovorax sp.]
MKKLIVALMVLATFASCGKKNSVDTGSTAVATAPVSTTNTLTTTASGAIEAELASKIDTNAFGTGTIYLSSYPETFSQLVTSNPNLIYKYGTMDVTANSSSSQKCAKIGGVPILCANWSVSTSVSASSLTDKRTVMHSSISDLDQKKALIELINKRSSVYRDSYYAGVYYIILSDATVYTIDTSRPLQANPVATQKSTGKREVLYGWSTN